VRHILLIDNLDSFTFNLVEAFERLGSLVQTVRNTIDARSAFTLAQNSRSLIVISPGPGRPEDAGCCLELIALAKGKLALLGICLGHQAILAEAGARVEAAGEPVHGKSTLLAHDGAGPFAGLANPLRVGRYHSLGVREVPRRFRVHARVDGLAMAISDPEALQAGLQFHPESILTHDGDLILGNLL
jgi:anthranilate synthase component II